MKKTALLNAPLSQVIATLGHTDSLTICDAGLPIPKQVERVDLALSAGVPSFLQTFHAVVTEMFVERAIIAEEIKEKNPKILIALLNSLAQLEQQQGNQIEVQYVSHD
ncbi:D-ribose pyranase, partial [Streptococcus suis]